MRLLTQLFPFKSISKNSSVQMSWKFKYFLDWFNSINQFSKYSRVFAFPCDFFYWKNSPFAFAMEMKIDRKTIQNVKDFLRICRKICRISTEYNNVINNMVKRNYFLLNWINKIIKLNLKRNKEFENISIKKYYELV